MFPRKNTGLNLTNSNPVAKPSADRAKLGNGRKFTEVKVLIWTYFLLLIFEGVLRKWVLPQFSDPLLLIRDPVLVLIYIITLSAGIFPTNTYTVMLLVLGALAGAIGITAGSQNLLVTAYGFDSMFFHLPLIFIIHRVMNRADVIKLGKAVLFLSVPMAVVMAIQFRSSPDALINCGVSGSIGMQIRGAMGKIRPPGFFTFITGAAQFLSFATVFLIFGFWKSRTYSSSLLIIAGIAIAVSAVVSTSRLALGGIGTVFVMIGVVIMYDRRSLSKLLGLLVPIGFILVVATNLDIFNEGRQVFEMRLQEAGDKGAGVVGTASNWTARAFGDIYGGILAAQSAPMFGAGLGVGTNVGARVLSGQYGFLLAEGEWARVVLELGPLLALPYMAIRIAICVKLFNASAISARAGNALPMLILGSCGMLIVTGQFSQASTLGFAVLQSGLCLAATKEKTAVDVDKRESSRKLTARGCSSYALRLREGNSSIG